MNKIKTDLPYLGNRNYLHSTQLLDFIRKKYTSNITNTVDRLIVKFKSLVTRQAIFLEITDNDYDESYLGFFTLLKGDKKQILGFKDSTDAVSSRIDFDESILLGKSNINRENASAKIDKYPSESFFSALVVISKYLVLSVVDMQPEDSLVLAQIDLERPFDHIDSPTIDCSVVSVIAGRMVKIKVMLDGKPNGTILYTVIKSK